MLMNGGNKMFDECRGMTREEIIASVDVTQLGWRMPDAILDWGAMHEIFQKEDAFQATLDARDPRHKRMFRYEDDGAWLMIFWGGYEYPYEMSRINRPEDLLWLIHHVSQKEWKHATGDRIGRLIESVSRKKGWPAYGTCLHPNEAPKPNHDKVGEREKMTASIRYNVIKRDAYRCRACGFGVQDGAHLHVDHIVAIANGGETKLSNLQTLCTVCNLGKAAQ
jgi:hypothetical protein